MDCGSILGAALIATLLEGRSKGCPLAVHGGGTAATALRVPLMPWVPKMLRTFALVTATVRCAEVLWTFAPIPATVRRAEMLGSESTVRLAA